MANKRELKKSINYVVGDLFQECIVLKVIKKADNAKVDEILTDILDVQNEFLARANHPLGVHIFVLYTCVSIFALQVR